MAKAKVAMSPDAEAIYKDFKAGLKKFGTYSYEDKGASEIMYLADSVTRLTMLQPEAIRGVLLELLTKKNTERLVEDLVISLDFHPFFDTIIDDPALRALY